MSADQHAALACIITCFVGLLLGAAWAWSLRTPRAAEFDAIAWSNEVWAELDREAS